MLDGAQNPSCMPSGGQRNAAIDSLSALDGTYAGDGGPVHRSRTFSSVVGQLLDQFNDLLEVSWLRHVPVEA